MDLTQNHFELFGLPVAFDIDSQQLAERYRELQRTLHPDRYASASAQEQRLAVQYSGLVNEAYSTLNRPLSRALYLLGLAGVQPPVGRHCLPGAFGVEKSIQVFIKTMIQHW